MIIPMTNVHPVPGAREPRALDWIMYDGKLVARVSDVLRDPDTGELLALITDNSPVYKHVKHGVRRRDEQ